MILIATQGVFMQGDQNPVKTPRVGDRRPIMALLDLMGRRWALRLLWELRDGPLTSRALRTAAGDISPTVLQTRVNELRKAGIVELGAGGYWLTALGRDFMVAFEPLYLFPDRWGAVLESGDINGLDS